MQDKPKIGHSARNKEQEEKANLFVEGASTGALDGLPQDVSEEVPVTFDDPIDDPQYPWNGLDNPRELVHRSFRIRKKDAAMIDYLCEETGMSKTNFYIKMVRDILVKEFKSELGLELDKKHFR